MKYLEIIFLIILIGSLLAIWIKCLFFVPEEQPKDNLVSRVKHHNDTKLSAEELKRLEVLSTNAMRKV